MVTSVYEGVSISVKESVYEPSEDSLLLAKYAPTLKGRVLDMGTGSGLAALANAKANPANEVIGADISPDAVACATENAKRNKITNARFIVSDFFSSINGKFDGMMFNPPYLPTEYNERVGGPLNHAFDGGKDGRKVLVRFLAGFDARMKPGGTLLLLQSSINGPRRTREALKAMGYSVRFMGRQDFFFESIWVVRAIKK
jgi:release factor glutamine methyltransferase